MNLVTPLFTPLPKNAEIPTQLLAIYEINWLARSYTNTPRQQGHDALMELIGRLEQESTYLGDGVSLDAYSELPCIMLYNMYRRHDTHRVPELDTNDRQKMLSQLEHFCLDWIERLGAWLNEVERLTEGNVRIVRATTFLWSWYTLEYHFTEKENRGHPRDLEKAGFVMTEALAALQAGKWRPKE